MRGSVELRWRRRGRHLDGAGASTIAVVLCEGALDSAGVGVGAKGGVGASIITAVLCEGVLDSTGIGVEVEHGAGAGIGVRYEVGVRFFVCLFVCVARSGLSEDRA